MKLPWKKSPAPIIVQEPPPAIRNGFFSTDPHYTSPVQMKSRMVAALTATFQRGSESLIATDEHGVALDSVALDNSSADISRQKLISNTGGALPFAQLEWYAQQGFIGWQTCAILAQNWLIDKACTMPGQDAIRHGWEISVNHGDEIDPKIIDEIRRLDKRFKMKKQCRQFVKMGRVFGIRHALFIVDGIDYAAPFNPDGVKPGSYRGISQIEPYWVTPELSANAASNPAAEDFYEPTWWRVNGQRVHKSHFAIMRNGDVVADYLKPTYYYGGIPIPQKIFERVYAAERTANEAPMLAMTKRLTALKMDTTMALGNYDVFAQKMTEWTQIQNNFGIKVHGLDEEISQFDTNLAALDETIMTQYQLVAAASNVPSTKLLGTTPKGFNSTGEFESQSYHEELESIQEHDLTPLIERHHELVIRSIIAPKFKIKPFNCEVQWKPVDSPTAKDLAEINQLRAQTDASLVAAGAIDGYDVRQRIIADPDSGYNGIEAIVPEGPGDREAQQEAEAALEQPVTAKVTEKAEAKDEALHAPPITRDDIMDMLKAQPLPTPSVHQIQPVINITTTATEQPQLR